MSGKEERDDDLLTFREAAQMLGIAKETVSTQYRKGTIAATKKYGLRLVERREVERYRREHLGKSIQLRREQERNEKTP